MEVGGKKLPPKAGGDSFSEAQVSRNTASFRRLGGLGDISHFAFCTSVFSSVK